MLRVRPAVGSRFILVLHATLDPKELCLPLPTGTGKRDIRFPFPLIARTLLGLVIVRFDNGLEFGSPGWSSSFSLVWSFSSSRSDALPGLLSTLASNLGL